MNAGMNGFYDVQLHIVARAKARPGMTATLFRIEAYLPSLCVVFLRDRPAALARRRSIWPLGKVTQISPIHSSLTPVIGLALKLVRLTIWPVLPRSMVLR